MSANRRDHTFVLLAFRDELERVRTLSHASDGWILGRAYVKGKLWHLIKQPNMVDGSVPCLHSQGI
jgi:hypothetical protein